MWKQVKKIVFNTSGDTRNKTNIKLLKNVHGKWVTSNEPILKIVDQTSKKCFFMDISYLLVVDSSFVEFKVIEIVRNVIELYSE